MLEAPENYRHYMLSDTKAVFTEFGSCPCSWFHRGNSSARYLLINFLVPGSPTIWCSYMFMRGTCVHTHTCTYAHTNTYLDTLFQSKVFWRKVTGEPGLVQGDGWDVGAGMFCARQGVVSTQHRPSATSMNGSTQQSGIQACYRQYGEQNRDPEQYRPLVVGMGKMRPRC
jgi:hypothetical protein